MKTVFSGLDWRGKPCRFQLDGWLKDNFDKIKKLVTKKDYDSVILIAGLPSVGKSNFAINLAKFCDPKFTQNNICYNIEGEDGIISKMANADQFTSWLLDEAFFYVNTQAGKSKAFLRLVNFLQQVRQKNLFIFLCIPNFFDISKTLAVFRASLFFMIYSDDEGDRGHFAVFDRNAKRELYIKGSKYIDYSAVEPNFHGTFRKQKAIDPEIYKQKKLQNLKELEKIKDETPDKISRDKCVTYLVNELKLEINKVGEIAGISRRTVYNILHKT